jgi:hypothetical protein
MNATLMERAANDRRTDFVARGIALAAVALFWWIWLTVWLGVLVAVAGSRSLDASPAAVLAGAAVAATILLALGLFLMNALFTITHTRAGVALAYLGAHWRQAAKAVLVIGGLLLLMFGGLMGFVAVLYGYAFALWSSMQLTIQAAEQVGVLTPDLSLDSATAVAAAFTRTYVAVAIVVACIAVPYLGGRQLFRAHPEWSRRGSL